VRKEFKPGEKIRFVGAATHGQQVWFRNDERPYAAVIEEVLKNELQIRIVHSPKTLCKIHPRQVTHRIVKKKLREFWLYRDIDADFSVDEDKPVGKWHEVIHVR
jgi:hypothetical protein